MAYAEDDDASERDFVFTVNEPGWQRQIPQSVYNLWPLKLRLKRAAQRSAVERHKTQDKGERRSRAQAENLSRNVAGISMFQCCNVATAGDMPQQETTRVRCCNPFVCVCVAAILFSRLVRKALNEPSNFQLTPVSR